MPHAYETQLAADYPLGHRNFTGAVHHHQRQTIGHRTDLAHPVELFGGGDQAHHIINDLRVYGDLLRHFLQADDLVAAEGNIALFGL